MTSHSDPYKPASFWTERLTRYGDLQGVGHVGLSRAYNNWMYRARIRNLEWAARRFAIDWERSRVLDVGFGTGFFEAYYERKGVKALHGVDINTATIDSVRSRFPQYTFQTIDVSTEPLQRSNEFDIASCYAVIYHIVDDEKLTCAVRNIAEALRPGGLFLLTGTLLMRSDCPQREAHYRVRKFADVRDLLERNGLEFSGHLPVTHFLNNPVDFRSPLSRSVFTFLWSWVVRRTLGRFALTGWILGALLYAIDGALLRVDPVGRSEKLTVWRKRANQQES